MTQRPNVCVCVFMFACSCNCHFRRSRHVYEHVQAVVEDGLPFVRTVVPPPLRYPLPDNAFPFIRGLIAFFYGHSLQAHFSSLSQRQHAPPNV